MIKDAAAKPARIGHTEEGGDAHRLKIGHVKKWIKMHVGLMLT